MNAVRHELYVSYIDVLNVDCIVSLILLIVILMFVVDLKDDSLKLIGS